jgi:hypothetical protein
MCSISYGGTGKGNLENIPNPIFGGNNIMTKTVDKNLNSLLFVNEKFVTSLVEIVISMETEGITGVLNSDPFALHGLTHSSTDSMRKVKRDTSYGCFGFTLGTTADNIDYLKLIRAHSSDHYDALVNLSSSIHMKLGLNSRNSKAVPTEQILLFLSFIEHYRMQIENGTVSYRSLETSLAATTTKLVRDYSADLDKFRGRFDVAGISNEALISIVANFYKVYNGVPDTDESRASLNKKIKRLVNIIADSQS